MRWKHLFLIVCFISACRQPADRMAAMLKDPENALLQEEKQDGWIYRLQYLPVPPETGDASKITLRLNIIPEQTGTKPETSAPVFNYGIDTLFSIEGSVLPVHAARVANGNITGIEYLVIFERTGGRKLNFHDVLFTGKLVEFRLNPAAMKRMDELNRDH